MPEDDKTKKPDDNGGSGGAGGAGKGDPNEKDAEIARLKAELDAIKAKKKTDPEDDDQDLLNKSRKDREAKDKDSSRTKRLEAALKFDLTSKEFLKSNESLLPKDVADIFTQAEKEKYEDAIEKDAAIKAGIVQSFFSVQTNVDLLTPGPKAKLDEYLKLTKNGKQDKAQEVYESIFEPAFEMLKRTRKAEALSKGHSEGSDSEAKYKNKLIDLSKSHYLRERK